MYFDTHTHLSTKQFNENIQEVINNAYQEKVFNMIVVGMDKENNQRCIDLTYQYDGLSAAVGIHPSDVDNNDIIDLIPLLSNKNVVAIGEIGIDLYWRKDNLERQKEYFIKQLDLSIKYNLPVIIHTRDSFDIVYDIVKSYNGKIKGVFHCFSSNHANAIKVIQLGMYIGISGTVTYPKALEIQEVAKYIPLDRIVIETDCPYLPPQKYRGKQNQPVFVIEVAKKIAELKELPLETIANQTTENAKSIFKIKGDNYEKNN